MLKDNPEFLRAVDDYYDENDEYELRREQVQCISDETNISAKSITQALFRMGIYKAKAKEIFMPKERIAEEILAKINMKENGSSLKYVRKEILERILIALTKAGGRQMSAF